jgi:hypothetical protein
MHIWVIGTDEHSTAEISSAIKRHTFEVKCFYFSGVEEVFTWLNEADENRAEIPHTIFLDISRDRARCKRLMQRMEEEFPQMTQRRVVLIDEPGNIEGVMRFAMNECARNILTKPILSIEIASILGYRPQEAPLV